MLSIGNLWIRWGCVQMKLFAVMESLDPQSQTFWEAKYLNEEFNQINKEKDISNMYRTFLTGVKQSNLTEKCWSDHGLQHPLLHATSTRLEKLKANISKYSNNVGLRPCGDEKYNNLRMRSLRFLSKYGWSSLCDESMENIVEIDPGFITKWSIASSDLLDFFLGHDNNSLLFPDLIEPLSLGISRVLVGMDIIERKRKIKDDKSESASRICEIFCQFPNNNIHDLVEKILKEETNILKNCKILIGDCNPGVMAKIHIKLLHLCLRLLDFTRTNRPRTIELLHMVLSVINNLWNKQQQKRFEKEEAESSIYVEKQRLTEKLSEEEIENLEIFMEICPNAQQRFDDQHMEMSSNMSSAANKIQELRQRLTSMSSGLMISENTMHSIVDLTKSVMSEIKKDNQDTTVFRDCYRFAAALISADYKNFLNEDCNLFTAHTAALTWEYESLSICVSENASGQPYDIYQDPVNVNNIIEAQKVLENVHVRVTYLLNMYPEHSTLILIQKKTNNILNLSLELPLIVFINNVERLIHEIQQWEIVAARHVSLVENIDELNKLLVNWRHQELTMWENSLNTDNWKLDRQVSQDFLKYYNLFIEEIKKQQYDNSFESINLILEPILNSLTNAAVGNYEFRLNLMKLLIDVISSRSDIDEEFRMKLKNILLNHYDLYGLYLKNIQQHLSNEFKRIGKELKDFIKTKKWGKTPPKITDVLKCHKIVFKYKRQWNGIINKSCQDFLYLNPINALKNFNLLEFSSETDIDFSESAISNWCKNMLDYCNEMWETMEIFQKETRELEEKSVIEAKSEEKEVLEKKWRSNVKNLQQRKRNCVTQFVKELREMGLIAHGSLLPRKTALMTHLPLGNVKIDQSSVRTIRCLGLRLQLDDSDKSEEFAKFNEFKDRLISICDHLLLMACTNTTKIVNFKNNFLSIQESIKSLVSTCQSEIVSSLNPAVIEKQLEKLNENNIEKLNQWLLFINMLKSTNHTTTYTSLIADELKPKLLSGLDNFHLLNSLIDRVNQCKTPSNFIVTTDHIECIGNQKLIIQSINDVIEVVKKQFSPESFDINSSIANSLFEFNKSNQQNIENIESNLIQFNSDSSNSKENLSCFIKDLESSVNEKLKNFKSILLTSKFDLSFTKSSDHLNTLESSLELRDIVTLIDNIKNDFYTIDNNQVNQCRIEINQVILPALKHLEMIENQFLNILLNYHLTLISAIDALLTVISKLMKEGFCAPNDSAWNGQDENSAPTEKMNDFEMAGMDSGVGSNDVSDQIESESQIEGNSKDQGNEDPENQSEVPDEDNGIEMSDDFDGKLHDPEVDESKNKDDENDDDDKLNDIEDKIGEVGDAPETDVNKQAWDDNDEKKEEDNTKNKDERKGGMSEENTVEMVAGNEEENQSKENGNKNENINEPVDEENFDENNENDELKDSENNENNTDLPETTNEEPDKNDLPEQTNEEPDKNDLPEEETNAIDDFWNEEACLEDNVEPESTQTEDIENLEGEQQEENIEDLKPYEESKEEEVFSNDVEQSISTAGGIDAMNDEETNYDREFGEENAESGTNSNGGGNNNITNTENAQGTADANESQTENKDSSKQNQDALTKPSENRKLGDVNENFKRKADVSDLQEDNEIKRPKTADAFCHIEKENNEETNDQVLDDATANQQQHIPEVNDEENDIDEPNVGKEFDKNENCDMRNVLEDETSVDPKSKTMVENKEKSDVTIIIKEKQQERFTWSQYESKTEYLSRQLCEMLRIVLEPTKANKLGGAYRTGKRLNMKKVIPYIASGFRKDKIWLRRNKPSQREYQVIIGVDNSESMSYNVCHQLFFESLAIVLNGLTFLEVGQVGLCKFGDKAEVVLPLYQQFSSEIGGKLVETFDFSDKSSKFVPILEQAIQLFGENRYNISSSTPRDTSQLLLLLSDGGVSEDVTDPKFIGLIREAHNKGIFVVVILLDSKASILNLKMVINDGCDFVRYLDVFPLQNYTVLQDVTKLPALLTDVLRKWFELSSSADNGPSR